MPYFGIGGRVKKSHQRIIWNGVWYKPWTWFRFRRVHVIEEFELMEVSLVQHPPNPQCIIKEN